MPDSATTAIGIIDECAATRLGLAEMLRGFGGYEVVASVGSVLEFISACDGRPVHIVLMDPGAPANDGVSAIAWLHARLPAARLLAFGAKSSVVRMLEATEQGACGYLPKHVEPEGVRLALDEIRVKGCYHHAALMRELMGKGAAPKPVARLPELTDRELDVLRQLAVNAQYTCERIADVLGIGLSSVKTHMKNLYKKLDVHSKTEAVLEALKLGLLSLADLHPAV